MKVWSMNVKKRGSVSRVLLLALIRRLEAWVKRLEVLGSNSG